LRSIHESAADVLEEHILTEIREKEVRIPIVIDVGSSEPDGVGAHVIQVRFARRFGKGAVAVVAIQSDRLRMHCGVCVPTAATKQQYVRPPVTIVVDESASRAHLLRVPLIACCSIDVSEVSESGTLRNRYEFRTRGSSRVL